jgi:hypothetical protein
VKFIFNVHLLLYKYSYIGGNTKPEKSSTIKKTKWGETRNGKINKEVRRKMVKWSDKKRKEKESKEKKPEILFSSPIYTLSFF